MDIDDILTRFSTRIVSASYARDSNTTAYAVGDLIGNTPPGTAASPMTLAAARSKNECAAIARLRLKINDSAWKGMIVRVHLFKSAPTTTCGDNDALNVSETYAMTESNYIGFCDITLSQQFTGPYVKGFGICPNGDAWRFDPDTDTQNLSVLYESRSIVTPGASKAFSLSAEIVNG